jgi:phosphocarrier protein FPr
VDYPLTPTLSWSTTLAGADVAGLHLRPASRLAQAAGRYRADIQIECGGLRADAKSVLSILVLGATPGALLRFTAQGDDAAAALAAMREALAPGASALAAPAARPPDHLQRPGADLASARCSGLRYPRLP